MRPNVRCRTLVRVAAPFWAAMAIAFGTSAHAAQEIRFKVVDGRLCARCTLQGPDKSIPATVVVDLGTRVPLVVHSRVARLLAVGSDAPATLRFGDLVLPDVRVMAREIPDLEELSNRFAPELDEIPAVAILGMPALSNYAVQLEVEAGVVRLLAAAEGQRIIAGEGQASRSPSTAPSEPTRAVARMEAQGYGYWLAGAGPEDFRLRVRFATVGHDTVIDATTADLAGSAGGAIDVLRVAGLNIARFVALRPEDLSSMPEPRPDVVLGNSLLAHFRVTVDLVGNQILFEQLRGPRFPSEEREYFVARAEGDPARIETFIKTHGASRLAGEASEKLLALRLEEDPADAEAIARAVRHRAGQLPENRRSQQLVALADELLGGKRADKLELASDVLKVASESSAADLNGIAAHQIQARLGLVALRRGDSAAARRHLLAAAFGMPRDPLVNLWLGELYEQSGKLTRAWSRYVQAALDRNAPTEAMIGLDRLNSNPTFRAAFTMEDAEQLLEGRVVEYHPAARYNGSGQGRPMRLVELFTCIDEGSTAGPQLAFNGLREYFEATDVVLLQYHLSSPAADPLTSDVSRARGRMYQVTTAPAACFDGGEPVTDAGGEGDVDKLFAMYRSASRAPAAPAGCEIDGTLALSGTRLVGQLRLSYGAGVSEGEPRLHVILCEKNVMAPGASKILVHKWVARAALTPPEGVPVRRGGSAHLFPIDVSVPEITAELERTLKRLEEELNIKFLLRPTYVDPASCRVVGIVQDAQTRKVLGARAFNVAGSQPSL